MKCTFHILEYSIDLISVGKGGLFFPAIITYKLSGQFWTFWMSGQQMGMVYSPHSEYTVYCLHCFSAIGNDVVAGIRYSVLSFPLLSPRVIIWEN